MSTPRKARPRPVSAGKEAAAEVRAERARTKAAKVAEVIASGGLSFRAFLTSPDYFPSGLNLSPAMLAIVDASDGRPDLIPPDLCEQLFRCTPETMPTTPPRVIGIGAGGRAGKSSRLLAPKALHASLTVPLPTVLPGEVVVLPLLANNKTNAVGLLGYIKGFVASSPVLRAMEVRDGPPAEDPEDVGNAGCVRLRRPTDGVIIEIAVRAAARAGGTVRGKTLPAFVLDEACFLYADDGHAVNDASLYDAANQRVVPGGQLWIASTPWIDGEGLLERLIAENWTSGRQGTTAVVAARVGTRVLNPTWDPDGSIERDMRAQDGGDVNADREILALPLPRGSRCYFPAVDVDAAMDLVPPEGAPYVTIGAGADYAHSSDASGLGVAVRYEGGTFGALLVMEIASSPDQKPSDTYKTFARAALRLGVRSIAQDNVHRENVREAYAMEGVSFRDAAPKAELYPATLALLRERRLALGNLPEADRAKLRRQFGAITHVPLPGGGMRIVEPRQRAADAATGKGTTHCDMLRALVTALWEVGAGRPETWAHPEERQAAAAAVAAAGEGYVPRPGSLASLSRYRAGGNVSSGPFW